MLIGPLLPPASGIACQALAITPVQITVQLATISPTAACPACGQSSGRVHSRYTRTVADLPWCGVPLRFRLLVRRFFCDNPACRQRIFAERLNDVTGAHGRKSRRLTHALRQIGFECGGEGGCRLAKALGMAASADTILDLLRQTPPCSETTPCVLGVDDWAWRKGQRYGTILCDLERHRRVDLLPERSAESFSAWLLAHPGVRIISRDRGGDYARGGTEGAPGAQQVADRFHLVHNLHHALQRMLDRCHSDLRAAARSAAEATTKPAVPVTPDIYKATTSEPSAAPPSRRRELYEQVCHLHSQGASLRQIASQLHMDRGTVLRFVHADEFPPRAQRHSISRVDRYALFLIQRWREGCHNACQLTRELRREGYTGSYYAVRRYLCRWKQTVPDADPSPPPPIVRRPSARSVAWMFLKEEPEREVEDQKLLEVLWQQRPELKRAGDLAREFRHLLRDRQLSMLERWIELTHAAEIPKELRAFADGLKQDYAAVQAAFSSDWSNGQVEGQINRLKMIKRQMYGRAGFALLRQRVLHAG